MYYVYVLQSDRDGGLYIGYTNDLRRRFAQHQAGTELATKARTPWKLVYYEASASKTDALHREHYLKTSWGRRYLKHRLKNSLKGLSNGEESPNTLPDASRDASGSR